MSISETQTEAPKPETKKRVRGDAITRLAKASANKVRSNSEKITDALVARVIEGDVSCAKLLVTLIDRLPPPKRKYRSIAQEWANSPKWKPPVANADPEDDESIILDELLGEEFDKAMDKYRHDGRKLTAKVPASHA